MLTHTKIVKSGNIVEVYEFAKAVKYGQLDQPRGKRIKKNLDMNDPLVRMAKLENRQRSIQHSKSAFKQIVNANTGQWKDENGRPFMPIFLTLTFGKDVLTDNKIDLQKCNRIFSKFKQRLDYEITKNKKSYLKYVVVIEFQKDIDHFGRIKEFGGRVHYHILFFNLPFMKNIYNKMPEIWGEGYIHIHSIKKVKNIASYVCKYMTKAKADERLCGEKAYFTSRGLKKPVATLDWQKVNIILNVIPSSIKSYEREIENEMCKKILYKRYDLTEYKELNDSIEILLDISNN